MHYALGIFEMNTIITRKLMMYVSRDLQYVKHSLFFPSGKRNPSPRINPGGRAKWINFTILNRLTFSTLTGGGNQLRES